MRGPMTWWLLLAALAATGAAQAATEYWFAPMPDAPADQAVVLANPGTTPLEALIEEHGGSVRVTVPAGGAVRHVVAPGPSWTGVHAGGVRVLAEDPLRPVVAARGPDGAGFLAALVPAGALGTSYHGVTFHEAGVPTDASALAVVATEDGTRLDVITPVALPALGVPPGGTATFHLDRGEYALLRQPDPQDDWTGIHVSASAPVAAFTSNAKYLAHPSLPAEDRFAAQLVPDSSGGKVHPVCASGASRPDGTGDRIRVVALQGGTTTVVRSDGGPAGSLQGAGDWFELALQGHVVLESNQDVLVWQLGAHPDAGAGGADIRLVPARSAWVGQASLALPEAGLPHAPIGSYTMQLAHHASASGFMLDGLGGATEVSEAIPGTPYLCRTWSGIAAGTVVSVSGAEPVALWAMGHGTGHGTVMDHAPPAVPGGLAMPARPAVCPAVAAATPTTIAALAESAVSQRIHFSSPVDAARLSLHAPAGLGPMGLALDLDGGVVAARPDWVPATSHVGTHSGFRLDIAAQGPCPATSFDFAVRVEAATPYVRPDTECPRFVDGLPDALHVTGGATLLHVFGVVDVAGVPWVVRLVQAPVLASIEARSGLLRWETSTVDVGAHEQLRIALVTTDEECDQEHALTVHVDPLPPTCPRLSGHEDVVDVPASSTRQFVWSVEDPDGVGHMLEILPPAHFRVVGAAGDEPLRSHDAHTQVGLTAAASDAGHYGGGYVRLSTSNIHCPAHQHPFAIRVLAPEVTQDPPEAEGMSEPSDGAGLPGRSDGQEAGGTAPDAGAPLLGRSPAPAGQKSGAPWALLGTAAVVVVVALGALAWAWRRRALP